MYNADNNLYVRMALYSPQYACFVSIQRDFFTHDLCWVPCEEGSFTYIDPDTAHKSIAWFQQFDRDCYLCPITYSNGITLCHPSDFIREK